jgi:hypothetical protein
VAAFLFEQRQGFRQEAAHGAAADDYNFGRHAFQLTRESRIVMAGLVPAIPL